MNEPQVILVDDNDRAIGTMGKQEAHIQGQLHRAISVLVFNTKGEWLIHQRALGKYHCGGLWTNTCCSHPAPGETSKDAAMRRLEEEMGIKTTDLDKLFHFKYEVTFDNDLIEHEIDHVFKLVSNDIPDINTEEVAAYKYLSHAELTQLINEDANSFTPWFKMIFEKFNNVNPS